MYFWSESADGWCRWSECRRSRTYRHIVGGEGGLNGGEGSEGGCGGAGGGEGGCGGAGGKGGCAGGDGGGGGGKGGSGGGEKGGNGGDDILDIIVGECECPDGMHFDDEEMECYDVSVFITLWPIWVFILVLIFFPLSCLALGMLIIKWRERHGY